MEVLGAVSSVFAVVSLAVQLNSTIQKLLEFWASVKDAPAEVAQIQSQLRVLSLLLRSIENEEKSTASELGVECLRTCSEALVRLQALSDSLDRGLNKSGIQRRWTCLKKAMRHQELNRHWNELERAKTLLLLYQGLRNSQKHDDLFSKATNINFTQQSNHTISTPLEPTGKPLLKIRNRDLKSTNYELHLSFGIFRFKESSHYARSTRILAGRRDELLYQGHRHSRITISFIPSYFISTMLEWTLSRGYNSWCFGLQTFNLRPDSSLIFKYCLNGNIDGVKRLIEDSLASPYDVDSQGATPLHFAACFHHTELCKLLLSMGAVPNVGTHRFESPLLLAVDEKVRLSLFCQSQLSEEQERLDSVSQFDTIRLLVEAGENDPMAADDVGFTPFLVGISNPRSMHLEWLFGQDSYDLDLGYKTPAGHTAAAYLSLRKDFSEELLAPLIRSGIQIDGPCADFYSFFRYGMRLEGPTMLQYTIWVWYDKLLIWWERSQGVQNPKYPRPLFPLSTVKILLAHGADLHAQSTSGHTVVDGILLNFIKFNGYSYSYEIMEHCKQMFMFALKALGMDRQERQQFMAFEETIRKDLASHELGHGLSMQVKFSQPGEEPWFWACFQGATERDSKTYHHHATDCVIWSTWQSGYAIPKRPKPSRLYITVTKSSGIIVLNAASPDVEKSKDFKPHQPASQPQERRTILESKEWLRKLYHDITWRLSRYAKYRIEFSSYILIVTAFTCGGLLTRLCVVMAFYICSYFWDEAII